MKVVISRLALSDIAETVSQRPGPLWSLEARCADLSVLSRRSRIVFPGSPPIHRATEGSYNIYYTVRADHVRVERIYHGRRNVVPEMLR